MVQFKLDEKLAQGCHMLGKLQTSHILLMNNSLVPWIVIVPEVNEAEFFQIEEAMQQTILKQINQLSEFISEQYNTDKLNVATIGNIVKQMHIHIVGRHKDDYCWPGVVWGASTKEAYGLDEVEKIKKALLLKIENFKAE